MQSKVFHFSVKAYLLKNAQRIQLRFEFPRLSLGRSDSCPLFPCLQTHLADVFPNTIWRLDYATPRRIDLRSDQSDVLPEDLLDGFMRKG